MPLSVRFTLFLHTGQLENAIPPPRYALIFNYPVNSREKMFNKFLFFTKGFIPTKGENPFLSEKRNNLLQVK